MYKIRIAIENQFDGFLKQTECFPSAVPRTHIGPFQNYVCNEPLDVFQCFTVIFEARSSTFRRIVLCYIVDGLT